MNVKELKELLTNFTDDAEVFVSDNGETLQIIKEVHNEGELYVYELNKKIMNWSNEPFKVGNEYGKLIENTIIIFV